MIDPKSRHEETAELRRLHVPLLSARGEPVFEDSALGIVATDINRRVLYANAAALAVIGLESYKDFNIREAFDDGSKDALDRALAERRSGKAGNYRATVKSQRDGRTVPIDITGVPLFDWEGTVAGALGIFRSLHVEDAIERIQQSALTIKDSAPLLDAIARDVFSVVPFDLMLVTRYSTTGGHAKIEFTSGDRPPESLMVWHPLSAAQQAWLSDDDRPAADEPGRVIGSDVWEDKRQEEVTRFIGAQYRKMLRRNVKVPRGATSDTADANPASEDRLVASVVLLSRDPEAFDEGQQRIFKSLPIDQAVLGSIDYGRERFAKQRRLLVEAVNACKTVQIACDVLAEKLRETFGWHQVCVYRVDYAGKQLCLSAARSTRATGTRTPEHRQAMGAGILGRVLATKKIANVGVVAADIDYLKAPHQYDVGSVLCCPIVFHEEGAGEVVRFVIDVDDRRINAFSSDDEEDLEALVAEVATSLQRISDLQYLQLCFDKSSDAIVVTDSYFNIRGANEAALRLLGAKEPKDLSGSIVRRFRNPAQFEELANRPAGDMGDLIMIPLDKRLPEVPVFVARQDFPDALGGSVFIARDTRTMRRAIELEFLSEAAYEVAVETSSPLSLALGQLEGLVASSNGEVRTRVLKVLRQLGRVKHAYEKLALFNERARPTGDESFCAVDLRAELEALLDDLTAEQRELVELIDGDADLVVRGDPYQVAIVFETLLSTLIRAIPEDQKVDVRLTADHGSALVCFTGKLPAAPHDSQKRRRSHDARMELQVAHPLLEKFMSNHGGTISRVALPGGRDEFTLKFPLGGHQ